MQRADVRTAPEASQWSEWTVVQLWVLQKAEQRIDALAVRMLSTLQCKMNRD